MQAPTGNRRKRKLNGKYRGLNGLSLGDDFGRNLRYRRMLRYRPRGGMGQNKIADFLSKDLTSEKAGLKYREIPANLPSTQLLQAEPPDL